MGLPRTTCCAFALVDAPNTEVAVCETSTESIELDLAMKTRMKRSGLAGLLVATISVLAASAVNAAVVYPVKVGPTGRYLVDQNNVPFLMAGESPQAMIGDLTEAEAEQFFENRRGHGFNTVWINLLCNGYTGCAGDGSTRSGIPPFNIPGDLSTPNEAYFAHAERIVQLAAQYGFLVILVPIETGGWLDVLRDNGLAKARAYGQFIGARYANCPNILWMHGNDFQTWSDPGDDALVQEVARGIQDSETQLLPANLRHLHTVELNYFVSGSLDDPSWTPLIQVNASYTYKPTYQQVLRDYNRSPFPVFMVEAFYELEIPGGTPAPENASLIRRQEYYSLLSGATGQLYGNRFTWQMIDGWQDQLNTPGAVQMAYLMALFSPRRWYDLVPDQAHRLVTAGLGSFGADDYVTAARTPDGTLAIAYIPSARAITVDMTQMTGSVTARWYDPSAGTFSNIPGSPFANIGALGFTTPGNNTDGDEDWVLVLEAATSGVTSIAPNPIDLATAPNSFQITGGGFADQGAGLPVVNFVANGVLVGQARATGLANGALTVPMPTNQTSLSGPLAGLSAGTIGVFVYNQTVGAGFILTGSTNLTVTDTRCMTCATIAPNPVDLAAAPSSFQITGGSFADQGAGLPVVNFVANGVLVGQARATGLANGVLMVPMPTNQTSLSGPLPGLGIGTVGVFVYNQTVGGAFNLAGSTNLTVSPLP